MPQFRLILLIIAVTACSTLFSLIIAKLSGWRRFGKLAVPLLLLAAAVYFFVQSRWFAQAPGFQDLGFLVLTILAFVSAVATYLLTELFAAYFRKDRMRRRQLP